MARTAWGVWAAVGDAACQGRWEPDCVGIPEGAGQRGRVRSWMHMHAQLQERFGLAFPRFVRQMEYGLRGAMTLGHHRAD